MNVVRKNETSGQVTEALGTLATVDRTIFLTMVKYLYEKNLIDALDEYLEDRNSYELIVDVTFINNVKRFLASQNLSDPTAKMLMVSTFADGAGAGSPTGIRG
jgi:hypothetical protein